MGNTLAHSPAPAARRLDESATAGPDDPAAVLSEDPRSPTEGIRRTPIVAIDDRPAAVCRAGPAACADDKRLCSTPQRSAGGRGPGGYGHYKRFVLSDSTNQTSDCSAAAFSVTEDLPSIEDDADGDEAAEAAASDDGDEQIPPADLSGGPANSTGRSEAGLITAKVTSRRSPLARLRASLRSLRTSGSGGGSPASPCPAASASCDVAGHPRTQQQQQQPRMLLWRKQRAKYRHVPAEAAAAAAAAEAEAEAAATSAVQTVETGDR